jgi:hypothetical protein
MQRALLFSGIGTGDPVLDSRADIENDIRSPCDKTVKSSRRAAPLRSAFRPRGSHAE